MEQGMIKVFFAHPKDLADAELDNALARLARAANASSSAPLRIVTARDDWARNMGSRGGWPGWQESIAGVSMGYPRFDMIVVGDGVGSPDIGKGTSGIIDACLSKGRDMCLWNGDATFIRGVTFRKIIGRRRLPGDDWKQWAEVLLHEAAP